MIFMFLELVGAKNRLSKGPRVHPAVVRIESVQLPLDTTLIAGLEYPKEG
jgi:hypothetical protein